MKITPLEIRQKTFEKVFRGLDKDEVNAFLVSLSQEWEKLVDENKELKIKLESSEKEVEKLREVENSLFKTLKTAEDTGANMIDQATKTAQLHLKETQIKSEAFMNEAKSRAKDMIEEAEMRSKNAIDDMEDQIKAMAQVYRTLENIRDDMMSDIKGFANDAIEKTDRLKSQIKKFDLEEELMKVKRVAIETNASSRARTNDVRVETPKPIARESKTDEKADSGSDNGKSSSFFDDIE